MTPPPIPELTIMSLLAAIEQGATLVHLENPEELQHGYPCYSTTTGWKILVQAEAGAWGRLYRIVAPDGRWVDLHDVAWDGQYKLARGYSPGAQAVRALYMLEPPQAHGRATGSG